MIPLNKDDEESVKSKILDFMWKSIDDDIKQENWLKVFNELKEDNLNNKQFGSLVADIISILDIQINVSDDHLKKDRFYLLINTVKNIIGDDLLKERLEIETLENLKLISKKEIFNQKYIKIKTRLFYKQQKFNLLREESEGYSKLITELNNINYLNDVNIIIQNIQSLIGCFNLDPNRVLDIILESFENNPQLFNIYLDLIKLYKPDKYTLTNLIGFKYQQLNNITQNSDSDYSSGNNLYIITAYLLKHSIINLDELKIHLSPTDDDCLQLYKDEINQSKQYAKKITINSLLNDQTNNNNSTSSTKKQPLSLDDMATTSGGTTSTSTNTSTSTTSSLIITSTSHSSYLDTTHLYQSLIQTKQNTNQKILLIKCLIKIGDFKNALSLLDKLPIWFLSLYSNVSISICKYLRNFLRPLYLKYSSLNVQLLGYLKQDKENDTLINSFEEFNEFILPILKQLGPSVSYDTILLTQLIRICIGFLNKRDETSSDDDSDTFYDSIYTIINDVLLPSISMLQHVNSSITQELWQLLSKFSYEMRYSLYNYWKTKTYLINPILIRIKAECLEKIKYLLKRLSKENVKIYGRQIGKLSHLNPLIINDYILEQIQRYDNFIIPIVDSLKYCTQLTYDCLSFIIITHLSIDNTLKLNKYDTITVSAWLQSIALFSGLVFKKYSIELIAIIQYVINQLIKRKSYDLLILQEIVQKMCNIEINTSDCTDLQLDSMCGGDLLRQEQAYFYTSSNISTTNGSSGSSGGTSGSSSMNFKNIKKTSNRLKEALVDHNLILPLCILLSQERDYITFNSDNNDSNGKQHLKLIGSLYDQCQDSLVQFSSFLSSTLTTDEYIRIFPKIDDLVNTYHVSLDVSFFLSRPMYIHNIQSKYDELRKLDRNTKSIDKPSKTQRYLEASDFVMQPVINLVKTLHPNKLWSDMSPLFYTTFWTLSCNDFFVPSQSYDKLKQTLKNKIIALDDNLDLTTNKKKKEKEKLNILIDKLNEEEQKQKDHVQHVKARLEKEKEAWFPSTASTSSANESTTNKNKNETINEFLQLCIFSRCLFTQLDAIYCAKFIYLIHSLKTPNFSTIICYDRIFSDISFSIASLTDNEARRYGKFLYGLLETVMHWHSSIDVFNKECLNYPGFLTIFRNTTNKSTTNKQEQLDYENYRHVCHKWHFKLTKSFIVCLESNEFIQIRNSLIILTKILPFYPKLNGFYLALDKRIDAIKTNEKEKRPDLYSLASVYLGQLRQRKSLMIDESKFHIKETTKPSTTATTSSDKSSKQQQQQQSVQQQSSSSSTKSTTKQQSNDSSTSSKSTIASTKQDDTLTTKNTDIKSPKRQRNRSNSRSVSPSSVKQRDNSKRIKTEDTSKTPSSSSTNTTSTSNTTTSSSISTSATTSTSKSSSSSTSRDYDKQQQRNKREYTSENTSTNNETASSSQQSSKKTKSSSSSAISTTDDTKQQQRSSKASSPSQSSSTKRSSKKNDNNSNETTTKSSSSSKDKRNYDDNPSNSSSTDRNNKSYK